MFSPVREMVLVPFVSGEGVALPPHVGFDLASKLVGHATAGSLHGTVGGKQQVLIFQHHWLSNWPESYDGLPQTFGINVTFI